MQDKNMTTETRVTVKDIIGSLPEEDFLSFDLTEIQKVLSHLRDDNPVDLAHAEHFCQETLRCADILSEFLAKITKTSTFLENKLNIVKNKAIVEFTSETKVTADIRKAASESSSEVEALSNKISSVKGAKLALEKKYEIIIKSHHHWKDIASGLRKTVLGYVGNV